MKVLKIVTSTLVVCGIILLSFSCSSKSTATTTTKTLTAMVQKGNITESITGTGNLAYSNVEKLAFEMAGYVASVLVSAGDTVKKGQELVKLDTSEWDTQLKTLEKAVTTANRTLQTKDRALAAHQRQVVTQQLAVTQAQLDVQTAQNNLNNTSAVATAQNAVDTAQANLNAIQSSLLVVKAQGDAAAVLNLNNYITQSLKPALAQAQQNLQQVLNGTSTSITTSVALAIASAQLQVTQKQNALIAAQAAVEMPTRQ